tara:strand:+ start:54 stop:263 length:210 start_codon:yes stop_codon:yes gene_type:complete
MATTKGTVKWFNNQKGYGFIQPEDSNGDLFVHQTDINAEGYRTLNEGDNVTFERGQGDKGEVAKNVTLA